VADLRITREPPDSTRAAALLERYYAELEARFPDGFDAGDAATVSPSQLTPPNGMLLLAHRGRRPVGCGAIRRLDADTAEIKRMWVDPAARGLGVGRGLLAALERAAVELGCATVRLDTAASLTEALALYRSAGYLDIAAYNDNRYAAHWLEKRVG
jgi:GNAT superfamily N-acetyltransferase